MHSTPTSDASSLMNADDVIHHLTSIPRDSLVSLTRDFAAGLLPERSAALPTLHSVLTAVHMAHAYADEQTGAGRRRKCSLHTLLSDAASLFGTARALNPRVQMALSHDIDMVTAPERFTEAAFYAMLCAMRLAKLSEILVKSHARRDTVSIRLLPHGGRSTAPVDTVRSSAAWRMAVEGLDELGGTLRLRTSDTHGAEVILRVPVA